jgi:hypothetical protein
MKAKVCISDGPHSTGLIIVDTKINLCKIETGSIIGISAKLILDQVKKLSNLTLKCPFEKVQWNVPFSFI